jgi:ferritin-like metal-binding protein YciE
MQMKSHGQTGYLQKHARVSAQELHVALPSFRRRKENPMRVFRNIAELVSLEDLLFWELADLHDAELQIVQTLPEMLDASESPVLVQIFQQHLRQATQRIARLEEIFSESATAIQRAPCNVIRELVAEGEDVIDSDGDPEIKDAALIDAAQRMNHYMIAGYVSAEAHARRLGYHKAARSLRALVSEETVATKELSQFVEQVQLANSTNDDFSTITYRQDVPDGIIQPRQPEAAYTPAVRSPV